jgi:hypothetical protein
MVKRRNISTLIILAAIVVPVLLFKRTAGHIERRQYHDNMAMILHAASGAQNYGYNDWDKVASESSKLFKLSLNSPNLSSGIGFLVNSFGSCASSNICIALAAPDIFIICGNPQPYAQLDTSALNQELKAHLRNKIKVEDMITRSIVHRTWEDHVFLRNYTIFLYWTHYLGNPAQPIDMQIAQLVSRATLIDNGFPKRNAPGYYWYARDALALICISGREDLLTGRSLGDAHEVFNTWKKWLDSKCSQLNETSTTNSVYEILNTSKIKDELNKSGYNRLWSGLQLFLITLASQ